MSTRKVDVAIVGGGMVGCWTAFFLRRRGKSVTVIEKGKVGAQASGVNFGSLRIQGRNLGQLPLSLRAAEIWENLQDLIGDTCEMETTGHIHAAFDATQLETITKYSRDARAYGLDTEILDAAEVRRRCPWLTPRVVGASWSPRDGAANPRIAGPAVARAIRAAGAEVLEGSPIAGGEHTGGGFRLTTAAGDTIESAALVNAAGVWGGTVAGWFGETVPIFAAGPADMVTEPMPYFMRSTVQAVDGSIVVRQIPRGSIVIAGHPRGPVDVERNIARVQPARVLINIRRLADLIPALASVRLIRTWSGLEGYFPDMLPVIGASRTTAGLVHGFGLCGNGFQISLAVGQVLSELVVDGTSSIPVAPFGIDRFATAAKPATEGLDHEFDGPVLNRIKAV